MRFYCRVLVLLLACAVLTVANVQGETEAGFTALFDGTDINGWRYSDTNQPPKGVLQRQMETPDKRFIVQDGSLVLQAKDKDKKNPAKDLTTVREFGKDFILKFEFKAGNEGTAHILVRGSPIQVADFIRRSDPYRPAKDFKTDDWNTVEITIKMTVSVGGPNYPAAGRVLTEADNLEAGFTNGKATAKLNGETIDPNGVYMRIQAYPTCNKVPYWYTHPVLPTKGPIAIRTGSGKLEFRNIRFKELP
jgi:hypothetical protein